MNFEGDNIQDGVLAFYNALGDRVAVYNIKKENKLTELDITTLAQGYYFLPLPVKTLAKIILLLNEMRHKIIGAILLCFAPKIQILA